MSEDSLNPFTEMNNNQQSIAKKPKNSIKTHQMSPKKDSHLTPSTHHIQQPPNSQSKKKKRNRGKVTHLYNAFFSISMQKKIRGIN